MFHLHMLGSATPGDRIRGLVWKVGAIHLWGAYNLRG